MRASKQNTAVQSLDEKVVCGDVYGVCPVLCFLVFEGGKKSKIRLFFKSLLMWAVFVLHELE